MNYKKVVSPLLIAISLMLTVGCSNTAGLANPSQDKETSTVAVNKQNAKTDTKEISNSADKKEITYTIYLPTQAADGVEAKAITLSGEDANPLNVIKTLIKEDQASKYPVFSSKMEIEAVTIKDGVAFVAVNKAFVATNDGDLKVQLRLASIVNTLTTIDGVKGVIFTLNDNKIKTIGNYDTREPLTRMKSLIK